MKAERREGEFYRDRTDAGRWLAAALREYKARQPVVLGLPRGGVPVAYEVAKALEAPLDVWVVRKLGAPLEPEYAIGAIAEGDAVYVEWDAAVSAGATPQYVEKLTEAKKVELEQRVRAFRGGRPGPDLQGKTVVVVDDGIATGRTVRAALQGIRAQKPAAIVLAVPVASTESLRDLAPLVEGAVCPQPERHLYAIGEFYEDFGQVSDEKVVEILEQARRERAVHVAQPSA